MTQDQHAQRVADPSEILERWEGAGGTWRVLGRRGDTVTISLCQCDGATEADRFTCAGPGLARYLAGLGRVDTLP